MLTIKYLNSFKKDYKKMVKRGCKPELLEEVVAILASEQPLPEQYHNHNLQGNYIGFSECHIQPDWLLIYRVNNDVLELCLARTGTHSDLF